MSELGYTLKTVLNRMPEHDYKTWLTKDGVILTTKLLKTDSYSMAYNREYELSMYSDKNIVRTNYRITLPFINGEFDRISYNNMLEFIEPKIYEDYKKYMEG